jgi:hypothetical protein
MLGAGQPIFAWASETAGGNFRYRGNGVNKPANPRRFARVKPIGRVSNAAKIVVGPKDPMVDCTLVDFSPGGACLEIGPQVTLPPRFELVHGNTRKRCRMVWKAGRRIGVSF